MNKSLWLLRLLHNHPHRFTRKEILDAWSAEDERGRPMPPSTFYDQCSEIERVYGVHVVNEHHRYALRHSHREGSDLLNFLIGNNSSTDIKDERWIVPLHNAIDERRMVRLSYQSIGKQVYDTFLSPYCLRMAQGRCYVVGFSSHHSSVRIFALDRIAMLTQTPSRFLRPTGFNAARFFQHSFGAFGGEELQPQHVVMRCNDWLTHYLRQRPLHLSQHESETGRFELDVALTKDFIATLQSFGSALKIEAPESLIAHICKNAREVLVQYGDSGGEPAIPND